MKDMAYFLQATDVHLNALDDLRAGEGSLPGKANDLFLAVSQYL